jgi:asparagine synthase (glutamine-hydrolysing)
MCGLTGWVSFERNLVSERPAVDAMVDTMALRGPDGTGTWICEHAALGHRRLAVIDLPGGAQPMTAETPAGPVTITYSGETYNFRELRADLRRAGHQFATASDTEVVLRGWLEWGEAVATRLNGMYAFAIWDSRAESLVMVRDRLGVKPLYFLPTSDGVLFGSEPKAILANRLAQRVVDIEGMRRLLAYTLTLPGVVWKDMREVRPGGIVTVDRGGVHERTYWTLPTYDHLDDQEGTVTAVRALLDDVVRRQLVADVPLGILLSGGLDSSSLTALAAEELSAGGERVRTYSVDFVGHTKRFVADHERADADGPFVAMMAERVGSDHVDVVLDHTAVADPDVRERVVRAYDVPPGSGDRDRSMYLLFRAIRQGSTVALSGESADELFGGYAWFHDHLVQRLPMFPWVTACRDSHGLAAGALRPDVASLLDFDDYLDEEYRSAASEVEHVDGASDHERRMRVICHLHLTRQLAVLLDRKDRLSMAAGLEIRVPYCDHRLVEYVYNAPWSLKTFDGREKSLLRAAVRDRLPAAVLDRVKSAFPSIQDPCYAAALQEGAHALVVDSTGPLFDVVERTWLDGVAQLDPASMPVGTRNSLEWVLNFAAWLEVSRPELRLS